MSIKVTFPVGSNAETVRGLYQWDIGQILEIESTDIDSETVEVHFACSNMNEAIVYPCTFVEGVGSVTIPDVCLEQSSTITAWIYRITDGGGYHTVKTITLPITARIRPGVKRDIPATVIDKYTELITEVNEAVGALKDGSVTVAKAKDATNAGHATSAGNAGTANHAITADSANGAKALDAKLYKDISWNPYSSITVTLTPRKAYAITFSNPAGDAQETSILLAVGMKNYSSRTAQGCYCMHDGSSTLTFYNSSGTAYAPEYIGIREL